MKVWQLTLRPEEMPKQIFTADSPDLEYTIRIAEDQFPNWFVSEYEQVMSKK